jgi:chromosome segregation ATPase
VEATEPAVQTRLKHAAEDSGLDDLVIQLTDRARKWREMSQELKRSKQREEDLRATNVEQTTRIDELEKTISENTTAASEAHQDPNLKSGMEFILGELGRIKAENKDLKATIKKHEDEARDSTYIFNPFHSNKYLESCGTFEVFGLRMSL